MATRNGFAIAAILAIGLVAGAPGARGQGDDDDDEDRICSATAGFQLQSCKHEATDDYFKSQAICINYVDPAVRRACNSEARSNRADGNQACSDRHRARLDLCRALGEERYDPPFAPALFDTDFRQLTRPNPWFPLAIGNRWRYAGGDETVSIVVLDKTKLIEGVTCIVVNDRVERGGDVVEDTADWYAHRKDGTVFYCGESVADFETFEGDRPREAELVSIDGSWKAGRGGDRPGIQMMAVPKMGAVYRQEFSANNAEDAARVLSATYAYGRDANLDRHVPAGLARHLCAAGNCVVTEEFSPMEPGVTARKYYAAGIGLWLEAKPTGEVVRLIDCNFDPRCVALP